MMYCLSLFDHGNEIGEYMHQNLRPMMHPNMTSDCVGWNGRCTDNKYVRHNVAQGYATYKSILHALATEYDWDNVHSGFVLTCEEGGELMDVRPVDENEPERTDYWTATNPDGKQYTYRSNPLRRQWANGWGWEASDGSWYIGEDGTKALVELLRLPRLTWEDEPYKFTVLKPKKDGK